MSPLRAHTAFVSPFRVRAHVITRFALIGAVALSGVWSFIPLAAQELPRALAPVALRLIDGAGRPIAGSCRDAHWNERGNGIFFTLDASGTRNIWRAFPDPEDLSRFPAWRASPVTQFKAPQGAARPVPLPGGHDLVCLQQLSGKTTQLALLNLATGNFTTLVRTASPDDPSPSPDGGWVAFTGARDDHPAMFLVNRTNGESPRLMALLARRPVWLDNSTLLYESLNPQAPGLYRLSLTPNAQPELVMAGGGEAGALPNGVGTVFSARTNATEPTRLYLIARDGSGLRTLNETEGARRPVPSRGGSIIYDAPLEEGGVRALWVLKLEMPGVMPSNLLGPNRVATIEAIGVGSRPLSPPIEPARAPLLANQSPVFPSVAATSLVPPLPPLGDTIVTPPSFGASIGFLAPLGTSHDNFSPPLVAPSPLSLGFGSSIFSTPPANVSPSPLRPVADRKSTGGGPLGQLLSVRRAVLSSTRLDASHSQNNSSEALAVIGTLGGADVQAILEAGIGASPAKWIPIPIATVMVNQAPFAFWTPPAGARGPWTLRLTVTNRRGAAQSMLHVQLPLPRLALVPNPIGNLPLPPPAPAPLPTPIPTPVLRPAPGPVPFEPLSPVPPQNSVPFRTPAPSPTSRPRSTEAPLPPVTPPPPAIFAGTFNISGTLATMTPGQKARVTFWGLNRGDTAWQTGGSGTGRVRLVARWVDFSTGTRRKWNVIWLKAPVAPGSRTNWEFDLEAPTRPGKYKLIYGLVRWPDADNFAPPPYNAPQAAWTGEFSAIAFAIDVVPPSAP